MFPSRWARIQPGGARRIVCAWLALAVGAPSALAQDVSVQASVEPNPVGLNQAFILTVDISGADAKEAANPELPDLERFAAYLSSSSSQQIQIVNGRMSASRSIQYRFQAREVGRFEIPPVTVRVGGNSLQTNPVSLEVVKSAASRASPTRSRRRSDNPGIRDDDLFLRAEVSQNQVYENEPVIVEYKIYTRVSVASYSLTRIPSAAGFWSEDFEIASSPSTSIEMIGGRRYTVAILKKAALFPTGPGKKVIESMTVECEIRTRGNRRGLFDDFFSDRSLFGRSVPKLITSEPIEIDVQPLPQEGRPSDFSGLVGNLQLDATLDKSRAETNEALTFKLQVSGEGNLRALPAPEFAFPDDFEVYPPRLSESIRKSGGQVSGRKTYEYVLIPRSPGLRTLPAFSWSYFDSTSGSYRRASTAELSVDVTGEDLTSVPVGSGRGEIRRLRNDIRFIKTNPSTFRAIGGHLYDAPLFWVVTLGPLVALLGAFGYRRHLDRLQGDVAYARRRRAGGQARKRLAKARSLLQGANREEFYAEVANALLGFLGNKLNIAEAGLISEEARSELASRGVSKEAIDAYFECLHTCDLKRFSPAGADATEMQEFLDRVQATINSLDKELVR